MTSKCPNIGLMYCSQAKRIPTNTDLHCSSIYLVCLSLSLHLAPLTSTNLDLMTLDGGKVDVDSLAEPRHFARIQASKLAS